MRSVRGRDYWILPSLRQVLIRRHVRCFSCTKTSSANRSVPAIPWIQPIPTQTKLEEAVLQGDPDHFLACNRKLGRHGMINTVAAWEATSPPSSPSAHFISLSSRFILLSIPWDNVLFSLLSGLKNFLEYDYSSLPSNFFPLPGRND